MALVLKSIYKVLTAKSTDKDGATFSHDYYPLTSAPLPVLLINLTYVVIVFKVGPYFMRNRKPFDLKRILLLYNLVQILLNSYIAFQSVKYIFLGDDYDITCIVKLPEHHPVKIWEANLFYLYYINKYIDYLETFFFVLRKKFKQVSFLHVYHHLVMTTLGYLYLSSYGFGGHTVMIGVLNSIVHVFMYVYYLASSLRPNLKKSLWWKKYITKIQIIQFIIFIVHQAWPLIFRPDCTCSKIWLYGALLQGITMLYLFSSFYIKTYFKQPDINQTKIKHKIM